ncbi:limonene-1,2-epoxide hydrolase family protein [Mycobacterium sp. NPDC003449]
MTPGDTVRWFCEATATRDVDIIVGHFHPAAVYQNIGAPASVGHEAIKAALAAQFDAFPGPYRYLLVNCLERESTVLTERIDILTDSAGREHRLPVMGTFEVENGSIIAWRDYWDSRLLKRMLAGDDCSALLP